MAHVRQGRPGAAGSRKQRPYATGRVSTAINRNGRTALAIAPSQRLMRASGRLRKPVLHCVEDQVYTPIHAKLSVNRA